MTRIRRLIAISAALVLMLWLLSACKAEKKETPSAPVPSETNGAPAAETPESETPETEAPETEIPATEPETETEPVTTEAATEAETESETETPPETESDPEPLSEEAAAQLAALRDWLEQPNSFELIMYYSYYPLYGFKYSIRQLQGRDESFRFTTVFASFPSEAWSEGDDSADWWDTEQTDWYYSWVDGTYICVAPDGSSSEVSARTRAQMARDSDEIHGIVGLLPDGIVGFAEAEAEEDARVFQYQIPLSVLLDSGSMGGIFLGWSANWSEGEATLQPLEDLEKDDPAVTVRLEAEPETLRPIRAYYDFVAVKPYLFGNGPLSAEFAMDVDVLYMTLDYSFDLPETVEQDTTLEEGFLSSAAN